MGLRACSLYTFNGGHLIFLEKEEMLQYFKMRISACYVEVCHLRGSTGHT